MARKGARLARQQGQLRLARSGADDVLTPGCRKGETAMVRALPVVIDIGSGKRPLPFEALAAPTPQTVHRQRRKVCVPMCFHTPSLVGVREHERGGQRCEAEQGTGIAEISATGDDHPMHLMGTGAVAAVTVCAAPRRDDHDVVAGVPAAFPGRPCAEIGPEPWTA